MASVKDLTRPTSILYNIMRWIRDAGLLFVTATRTESHMEKAHHKIQFAFQPKKAIHAMLWFLYRNNQSMDKFQLVKLFFLADKKHLVEYGRPIAGGKYLVMAHGPVCSELLDMLNTIELVNAPPLPFSKRGAYDIIAAEPPDTQFLSESDLNVLDEVYHQYGHIDKWKLRNIVHELASCKKNEPVEGEKRHPLPYEDFFEDYPNSQAQRMLRIILDEQEAWADFI